MGYVYSEQLTAPKIVEFLARTPQGCRVVRIYLDSLNPRFAAFNESNWHRTPATLSLEELNALIERAREICSGQ